MRTLDLSQAKRILVRGTNWVGDAVMTLPALKALHQACPQAELEVLARPWVAAVYEPLPHVSKVRLLKVDGPHKYAWGRMRAAAELRSQGYDAAVLFQNAIEAAFIALWARAPLRVGFNSDGRGLLLTHSIKRLEHMRQVHETSYYLWMLCGAGLLDHDPPAEGVVPKLMVSKADQAWADEYLVDNGISPDQRLAGLAPGAAFGPAKCWPAAHYAGAADLLAAQGMGNVLLFGSGSERPATAAVAEQVHRARTLDLAGATNLGQALGLLSRLALLITNDSGLMHAAAALGIPTVAVFGSTNPTTTGPLGPSVAVVRHEVDCAPCKKAVCPTDLKCLTSINPDEVVQTAMALLGELGP